MKPSILGLPHAWKPQMSHSPFLLGSLGTSRWRSIQQLQERQKWITEVAVPRADAARMANEPYYTIRIAKDESKSKGTRYWMILIYHNIYKFHHIQPKNLLVLELQVRANTKPGLEEGVYSIRIYSREKGSLKHERSQSLGPMFSAIACHRHRTTWVKESISHVANAAINVQHAMREWFVQFI